MWCDCGAVVCGCGVDPDECGGGEHVFRAHDAGGVWIWFEREEKGSGLLPWASRHLHEKRPDLRCIVCGVGKQSKDTASLMISRVVKCIVANDASRFSIMSGSLFTGSNCIHWQQPVVSGTLLCGLEAGVLHEYDLVR